MSGQGWNDYERAADKGPLAFGLKVFFGLVIFSIVTSVVGYGLGWFSSAAEVAKDEFGPKAALAKYEWFKDAAAQLDKKQADIKVYQSRLDEIERSYMNEPRSKWTREDREQYNTWSSEVAGVKASYNSLAAEYNAQMAKFNWRFANAGDLPKGADSPLPREYPAYIEQ
jgi:hypothetical protein